MLRATWWHHQVVTSRDSNLAIKPAPTAVLKAVACLFFVPTVLLIIPFKDELRMFIFMFVAAPGWIFGAALSVCYGLYYAAAKLWRMAPRPVDHSE
jgi:O-antigen/teichoic acid export membrane protein